MSQGEAQRLPEVWNVPYGRNPTFTGRADDLDRLRQGFERAIPRTPLQAIHGLGGVGKTQLALEYAYRFASHYDVVWWLRSGEPTTLAADFADLAVALRLPGSVEPDRAAAVEAVKQWLGRRERWLLIFNGAREPGDVAGYLPPNPRGHVIVTSRNAGWGGVALPLKLNPLKTSEAVELLLARSGQREGQEGPAREVVAELGALPLALAQAGAYIEESGTSVREYLRRFRERRADLMKRGADGADTVATAWNMAFEEAQARSPAAVELLDLCAFLAHNDIPADALRASAGFPPALAAAVSDPFALDAAVGVLRRYSLIEWHDDALSVHPLVQAAARDRLSEADRRTWATIAVELVSAMFPDDPDDPAQRGACRRWLPHARAALRHAREVGAPPGEAAERLLRCAGLYQYLFGFDRTAKEMFEQALEMAETLHGRDHEHVAMACTDLGLVLARGHDLDGALVHARRALAIDEARFGPQSGVVATDLVNLAAVLKEGNALDEARRHAERALRIDRALGPDNVAAVARDENNLGAILRELSDLAGARHCFERAIAIDQDRGAPDLVRRLNNLGFLLREMRVLDDARLLAERVLAEGVDRYGPDDPNVATFHSNLASVLNEIALRDRDKELLHEARAHLLRAVEIGVQTYGPDHYVVAIRRNNLGLLLADLGDARAARVELDHAVAIARRALGADHPRVRKLENNRAVALGLRKATPPPR